MADKNCPHVKYLFNDCMKTDTGEYRCIAQGLQPEDANFKSYDYPVCDRTNHKQCSVFLGNKLEKELIKK